MKWLLMPIPWEFVGRPPEELPPDEEELFGLTLDDGGVGLGAGDIHSQVGSLLHPA